MKRYRSALILLLILAIMSGGYYFYTYIWPTLNMGRDGDGDGSVGANGDAGSAAPAATESIGIVDRKSDELQELTVKYLSEEFVLLKETFMEKPEGSSIERETTRWSLTNRNDFPVDSAKLSTAATNFCIISSTKIVEENAYDLAQYGFGLPGSATAAGIFNDGAEVAIEIGSKNPTNDANYVRRAGENTVYLGSTYSSEKIMIKKNDIADLTLFNIVETDIERIEMKRGGESLFIAQNQGEYVWELESPVIAPLNTTAQGMIMESLVDVSAVEYAEMGASELDIYGLDKPKYSLLFDMFEDGEKIELLIGNEKSVRATAYAMLGGSNNVFVLSLEHFGYLDKPIKEFVDSFAYIVNINDVSHIQADFDGKSVMVDIYADMDSDDEDVFIVDGVDVSDLTNDKSRSIFRLFYQSMIGVTIYDLELGEVPRGDAEISFLYELEKEPFSMLVEFVPKDERLYYVFRNNVYAGITVDKRFFDREDEGLRPVYSIMKEAMDKAEAA